MIHSSFVTMLRCCASFLFIGSLGELASSVTPVLHAAPELPCFWKKVGGAVGDESRVTVEFAMKQRHVETLRAVAANVSDPRSNSYGQFLTAAEVRSLTAPDPAHVAVVERWLSEAKVPFSRSAGGASIEVTLSVASATALLRTQFHHVYARETGQRVVRAGDFWLPSEVHDAIAAVYGLHGLPLPPRKPLRQAGDHPPVTPTVLASTYQISGVGAPVSPTNRQAVASFEDQTMNSTDLASFFHSFVPGAPASAGKVDKFVGDNGLGGEGEEAGLDIEYLMGVSPGIKTDFYYYSGNEFCAALKKWTDSILADDSPPLVHSISYGQQGPMSALGCTQAAVDDVDTNFVKLAARGITLVFGSGDSGSGWAPPCESDAMVENTAVIGTGAQQSGCCYTVASQCCYWAGMIMPGFTAWSFTRGAQGPACSPQSGVAFEGAVILVFNALSEQVCCDNANQYEEASGYTFVPPSSPDASGLCSIFSGALTTKSQASATSSRVTVKVGNCTAYRSVTSTATAPDITSGGSALKQVAQKLYPAWPASSPWVTAVGATRFINRQIGQPEMASDVFGSGGGFSTHFEAFQDQVEAVRHYLTTAPSLPPASSFPAGGRATPDVSLLGEGYQYLVNGKLEEGMGTSAATPAFAGMVSLLNEARLQAGKPAMGYLNPFLYQNSDAFNDVTVGSNRVSRAGLPIPYGFNCTVGWDPVTGLGTPIFTKLLSAALSVGSKTVVV